MGKETRQQAPQYKLHYMCLPWCYRTMITSYQLPWCYRTMVSSYLLLLKTLFSPTLLLLSYHAITIAPKIYCKWTSLSDRTYRTNLGVCKSKHSSEPSWTSKPLEQKASSILVKIISLDTTVILFKSFFQFLLSKSSYHIFSWKTSIQISILKWKFQQLQLFNRT